MCTYGVLPACVNVTWLYLCFKKSSAGRRGGEWSWGGGVASSKRHRNRLATNGQQAPLKRSLKRWAGHRTATETGNWWSYYPVLGVIIRYLVLGWLCEGAFRTPFYQQLSSKNSSLLPTWFLHGEVVSVSNQGWKLHLRALQHPERSGGIFGILLLVFPRYVETPSTSFCQL